MTPHCPNCRCADAAAATICAVRVPSSDFPAPCGRELPCPVHGAPKSAEASMKERIEGLERELEHIRHSVRGARIGLAENGPGWMREWFDGIEWRVTLALYGPSDPDRDRETQAEQVKP